MRYLLGEGPSATSQIESWAFDNPDLPGNRGALGLIGDPQIVGDKCRQVPIIFIVLLVIRSVGGDGEIVGRIVDVKRRGAG